MALTYVALASVTVGSGGAAFLEFTNIPQTYTDLIIFGSLRSTNNDTSEDIFVSFNGVTTNWSGRRLYAFLGTSTGSNQDSFSMRGNAATATANTFGNSYIYIPNYTGSTNKSVSGDAVAEHNGANAALQISATLWSNTAAITSIKLDPEYGANLVQYSSATLYGIKNTV